MSSQTVKIEVTNVENVVVTSNGQEYMLVPKKDEIMEVDFEMPEYVRSIGDYGELNHGITPGLYKVHRWTEEGCPVLLNNSGEEVKVEEFKPATALEYYTQEAKKRGFKKGVKFKSKCSGIFQITNDNFYFRKNQPHQLIFAEGQGIICDTTTDTWAEIVKDEVEFIPGKLYESEGGLIVACTISADHDIKNNLFSGLVCEPGNSCWNKWSHHNNWSRRLFTPFTGTITL